ncbi:MAG: metallophosphoesterase family protein [candidate division WOR-3 bacterium]
MRIIIISDTHIPKRGKGIPFLILKEIEKCDLIIHAGDFTNFETVKFLESLNKFYGVAGNMDEKEVWEYLPEKRIIEINNKKIGIIHGFGPPIGIESKIIKRFEGENVDIIVYGHTHRASIKNYKNILLLNPGSPTDTIFSFKRTYMILEIGEEVNAQIFEVKD